MATAINPVSVVKTPLPGSNNSLTPTATTTSTPITTTTTADTSQLSDLLSGNTLYYIAGAVVLFLILKK